MPYNVKKNYKFTPNFDPSRDLAIIPTVSISPATLIAGGTFFSSIARGEPTNKISVELEVENTTPDPPPTPPESPPPEAPTPSGSCILTVRCSSIKLVVLNKTFIGDGSGILTVHSVNDTIEETISVVAITRKVFSVVGSVSGSLGTCEVGKIFRSPKFIFTIFAKNGSFSLGDRFTFDTIPNEETFEVESILPSGLRGVVNGASRFITMPPFMDGPILSSFAETSLTGGGGFPENPLDVKTGVERVLVQVNKDGDSDVFRVYEWVGDSPEDGSWQLYS